MPRLVLIFAIGCASITGCATPQYAIRPPPVPDESASARQIEQTISVIQAKDLEREGVLPIGPEERLDGFAVQRIVDSISQVTERAWLHYRAYLLHEQDPNAVALADGRIYLTSGLLSYLASRGSRPDELAFVLGHEIAHTVAQHLVKRYQMLQQQQLLMTILAAGASAVTHNAGANVQQAGQLALDIASLLRDVQNSGYSQEQELEADQLGVRYLIRAGFDPQAALDMLQDFERFEVPSLFLRTHPYVALRREYLYRYLAENGLLRPQSSRSALLSRTPAMTPRPYSLSRISREDRRRQLQQVQKMYPVGSLSWQNLQHQIDALEVKR